MIGLGLSLSLGARGGGGSLLPPTELQAITNRSGLMPQFVAGARTSGNQKVFNRQRHYIGEAGTTELVITTFNRHVTQNVAGAAETNSAAFTQSLHIEYNGVTVVATYDAGGTSASIAAGALGVKARIPASAFGLSEYPAGALIYLGIERTFAVGATPSYFQGNIVHNIPGEWAGTASAAAVSKIGTTGLPTTADGYTFSYATFGGIIVAGIPKVRMATDAILGVSNDSYVQDTLGDGVDGFGGRYKRAAGTLPYRATINMSVSGDSYRGFCGGGSTVASPMRMAMMAYANSVIISQNGSDFTDNVLLSDTITRFNAIVAAIKALPNVKAIGTDRMLPKSDSTNGFIDEDQQTVRAGFNAWRDAMDANAATQGFDLRFNSGVDAESATTPGKWSVYPGGIAKTADGSHLLHDPHGDAAIRVRAASNTLAQKVLQS